MGAGGTGLRTGGELYFCIEDMKRLVRHRPMDYSRFLVHGRPSCVTSAGLVERRRETDCSKR